MTEEKIINGKALYTPKGAAMEYGRFGCNFYTGCPHECEYCYLKRGITGKALGGTEVRLKKCFVSEEHARRVLLSELDKHEEQCQRYGIFLSFTTDPLIDETRRLTAYTIIQARGSGIPVWVLTKCSTFIYDEEFMSTMECINKEVRKYIHFGFTLTGRDDMEPKANTNADRIMAMRRMHLMGFSTFASIEPVIDWPSAERIVREAMTWCDHFKLGLRSGVGRDYYDTAESGAVILRIVKAVESFGKTIYLKESTRRLLQQYLQPGAYEELLTHTVDLDGNRITL